MAVELTDVAGSKVQSIAEEIHQDVQFVGRSKLGLYCTASARRLGSTGMRMGTQSESAIAVIGDTDRHIGQLPLTQPKFRRTCRRVASMPRLSSVTFII